MTLTLAPWMTALHLIAMVCWFAGLFYLPRLFIYHLEVTDEAGQARFSRMQQRLYRIIMNPAMIATLVFGILNLALMWAAYGTAVWLWLKLFLVFLLVGYQHYCLRIMRGLAAGQCPHSERFLRIFNEIPTLALIAIILLAVLKPGQ